MTVEHYGLRRRNGPYANLKGERGTRAPQRRVRITEARALPWEWEGVLRCDVMVALGILVPSVSVRIATPQQNLSNIFDHLF